MSNVTGDYQFLNFAHPNLPAVFANNSMQAVNGALWTLKIEVLFYISVPLLVWLFRWTGRWRGVMLIYVISFCLCLYYGRVGTSQCS